MSLPAAIKMRKFGTCINIHIYTKLGLITNLSSTANKLKSMLLEFDGNLMSKDNFIQDQRVKLGEKEKVISNQKTEIERLEKKSKMLEYKVPKAVVRFYRLILRMSEQSIT